MAMLAAGLPLSARAEQTFVGPVGPTPVTTPEPAKARPIHFMAYSSRGQEVRESADGMGLFAKAKDDAVDLTDPDHMVDGPSGSLFNQAAGIGWRNHNVSAMFGYMKPSSIKSATQFSDEHTPTFKSSARFGLGWSLHF